VADGFMSCLPDDIAKCLGLKLPDLSEKFEKLVMDIFNQIDADHGGTIDKKEALQFFKSQGASAEFHANEMFRRVKFSKEGGELSKDDWKVFWQKQLQQGYTEAMLTKEITEMRSGGAWRGRAMGRELATLVVRLFKKIDSDKSGVIDLQEAKEFFKQTGLANVQVASMFTNVDDNTDHEISLVEWKEFWLKHVLGGESEQAVIDRVKDILDGSGWQKASAAPMMQTMGGVL